jgi:polyisoprenoid-binding protein YceI
MASRPDHVNQITRPGGRGMTGWPSMQGARRREQGGIVTFLMGAIVVVVALGAAGYWFLVRSDAAPRPTIEDTDVVAGGTLDGHWVVEAGQSSFVQYRVRERFVGAVESDATGRTDQVAGEMTIAGPTVTTATVGANVASLTSDKDRRDRALHTSGLQSDTFPQAKFVLTKPITLPQAPRKGEKVTTAAAGDFTLHGITRPVSVGLVARWDGENVQVVGDFPVQFADYGITPPSIGGFVTVKGEGQVEMQLFFVKR